MDRCPRNSTFDPGKIAGAAALRTVIYLLLLVVLGLGCWRMFFYHSDAEKGLAQLRAAYKGQRPIEARLTTGFEFAPVTKLRGGETTPSDPQALNYANRLLLDAVTDSKTAKSHNALGILYLLTGKTADAINELTAASDEKPDDAGYHCDLAAAFIESASKAQQDANGEEFFRSANSALEHLNRALTIDPARPEALFNKALLLEKMTLADSAATEWNAYLEKEPASPWAREAQENRDRARVSITPGKEKAQILDDYLAAFRAGDKTRAWEIISQTKETISGIMVHEQLTLELLTARAEHKAERTAEMNAALAFLGVLEEEKTGDKFFKEAADNYREANETQIATDLRAYQKMQEARRLILGQNFDGALADLEDAKAGFLKAGNKWSALIAEFNIGYCLGEMDKIAESNSRLSALSTLSREAGYKWIQTVAEFSYGGNFILLGEFSKGIEKNKSALALARLTSDTYNVQRSLLQIAEQQRAAGDPEAMGSVFESLTLQTSYYTMPRQRMRNLFFATRVLSRFHFYEPAAEYSAALADLAGNQLKDRWMNHLGYTQLASIYGALKKYPEAFNAAAQSRHIADDLENGSLKRRLTILSLLTQADLERESGDCGAARNNYHDALALREGMETVIDEYQALKGQFLCDVSSGDDGAVSASMPNVLSFLDENREKISQEGIRDIFFDTEQGVYDSAIDYVFTARHDSDAAFDYAETSRARSLLSRISPVGDVARPMKLTEIQARMPADSQILYYAALKERLLIWRISRDRVDAFEAPVGSEEIESKVADYLKDLGTGQSEPLRQKGEDLYRVLVGPAAAVLEKDKILCIIADKSLFKLPFTALATPGGNYFIEDQPLILAPSASIFIEETEAAAAKQGGEDSILAIGDPEFSAEEYPKLAPLPDAKSEAEKIAQFYRVSKTLVGKEASKPRVLAGLDQADVLHFAGHYLSNLKSPFLSNLVLDKDLPVQEIMDRKLKRPRLIVLSACETGTETYYNGEGMIGAARAFLAAGIPVVVATQWPVESRSAARLMEKFHFYRKEQGKTNAEALRSAQLDMIRETDPRYSAPLYWAGYAVIGGYSNY